jgi:ABC-type branched-subunit amino acid transport system ATPase component/ABC-type branched-subunit amino acid transport system permease subunit
VTRTIAALREAAGDARRAWSAETWAIALALGAGALVALFAGSLTLDGLAATVYAAVATVGLSLAVGLAGMPSLAQGAFVGVGALVATHVRADAGWPPLAAALLGMVAAAAGGALTGLGLVRLRPAFVAVATWILTWLFALFVAAFPSVGGGAGGLIVPPGKLLGISLGTRAHYEVALVLLALSLLALAALRRGAVGQELDAVRQRPAAAAALGLSAVRLRLVAFTAAAAIGGLAGGFAVQLAGVFDPGQYGAFLSFSLFVAVLLGGARPGPAAALGAFAFGFLEWVAGKLGGVAGLETGRLKILVAALLVLYVLGIDVGSFATAFRGRRRRAHPVTPAPVVAAPPAPAKLEARSLTRRFGSVRAASGVSLELESGRVVALIGPNGSGKTTVLRLVSGTLSPDQGRVLLDGEPLGRTARARAERGVVRTLQATSVFAESTALENVLAGTGVVRRYGGPLRTLFATPLARLETAESRARAQAILEDVGLERAADTPAGELSGADQRVLMIAAALAARPRVLLLDEPSAGAAPAELARLAALIRRLRDRGLALLVVEHNLRLVRSVADRIVVLDAGETIADGSADEVAADPGVRAAYLGRRSL